MDIYNNLLYVKNSGEDTITYNDKPYFRYMDKLYIPNHPSELSKYDVQSLSEIRIKMSEEIIDYSYTKELIKCLIDRVPIEFRSNMIDFGCGGGILAEVIQSEKISGIETLLGLDISGFAVKVAHKEYQKIPSIKTSSLIFDETSTLDYEDNFFGSIISSFVMQFPIYDSQLKELYRVLKNGGVFVYNDYIYHRYPGHTKKIIRKLLEVGFEISEETVSFRHPDTNDFKNHKIVIAKKY